MHSILDGIGDFFGRIWTEIASFSLTGILWLGLIALTICLIILMRTRWGYAKPVWKCVVLSIAAHILLGGFAYGTKLVLTIPASAENSNPVMNVAVVDSGAAPEPSSDSIEESQPWNKLPEEDAIEPKIDNLDRVETNLEESIAKSSDVSERTADPNNLPADVQAEFQQATIPNSEAPVATGHEIQSGTLQAHSLQVDRSNRTESDEFVAPQINPVSRPETKIAESSSITDSFPESRQQQSPEIGNLLNQLAESTGRPGSEPGELPHQNATQESGSTMAALASNKPAASPFELAAHRKRPADGQAMPDIYALRSSDKRSEIALQLGGTRNTEMAVDAALLWLSQNQEADGRWSAARHGAGRERLVLGHDRKGAGANADTGITSLALLSFLASGNTHLEGEYRETVQKGLEYLLSVQKSNGSLAGDSRLFAQMYCHAMGSLALSEALAVTGDQRLLPAVQRAVNYSAGAQNVYDGGWRYQPGDQGDMSQFGWQVMALKAAEMGGANVPERTKQLMKSFLERCTSGSSKGLASYRPGQGPSTTMTAEALLCRYFLYETVPSATAAQATKPIMAELPTADNINLYYWYYATLALYHVGGKDWESWNNSLTDAILATQNQSGDHAGSWDPEGIWAGYGGRVYSTAMSALCLEVYYRYSRVAQRR